ncbi:MAG: hypothetical protein LBQ12_11205 [Deltaproteobacteria bacterium]|jgi:hypothetical protein|nr:hypothetical protein [Deltaproteobacteria bacterium]
MTGQDDLRGRPHTYLFKPGLWQADGVYYDTLEKPHLQTGELLIEHAPDAWTIDSRMNVTGQDRRDFVSRYTVTPFKEGVSYTEWKSHTGGPEPVFGLFVVVQESILMPWQSQSGKFWGQEVLSSVTPDLYLSRGFAFIQDRKAYSWAVKLARVAGGEGEDPAGGPCGSSPESPGSAGRQAGVGPEGPLDSPGDEASRGGPEPAPEAGAPQDGPRRGE